MIISEQAANALKAAVSTRGKHKGLLLAKAPASQTMAYAAWQAAQMCCNPFKVSIAGMIFMTDEQRAIYDEVLAIFEGLKIKSLDRDRNALERMGVW